jgi:2-C-methyl-D-erythritol 4-phosphate cytidylyltransferase
MMDTARNLVQKYSGTFTLFRELIPGGEKRTDSVRNALDHLRINESATHIAIHDAARPFLKPDLLSRTIKAAFESGSAAPAIKLADTIKTVNKQDMLTGHIDRSTLRAIQTPQVFPLEKLYEVYNNRGSGNSPVTDDTQIYHEAGHQVRLVEGDRDLFKITWPEDLDTARYIYRRIKKIWK